MEEGAIPLCLPDNFSWDETTNKCIKQGENRSSYKTVDIALRRLEAIQGPLCVVAVAGPLRKGKSFILSQPFAGNREIFPLGHNMNPETVGLWMWIVPEKYFDGAGNELTVVLIDSEGIDSSDVEKRDDDTILTLAVLLSSVLIYNSAGVPNRSDLETLRFVMNLSQRVQVFTGKETTSVQAQMVFPSFIWLLRDFMLTIPEDCKDLTDYFKTRVFASTSYKFTDTDDKAQQVTDTLLNFFPSFKAFSLPIPSFDPKIVQTITHKSSQSALNPNFPEEIKRFAIELTSNLRLKTTPDDIPVSGPALSSMVESYVQTLNTPGSVPSVSGAWKQYIGKKAHEIYQIANAIYFNAMKGNLEGRLPCESQKIRNRHTRATEDVSKNVFKAAVKSGEISSGELDKYTEAFQVDSEDIESSWLLKNKDLTEKDCETVFQEVMEEILTPSKDAILKNFENQGEAELRLRSVYDTVINEFKRRCRGCTQIVYNLAVIYNEELEKAMNHDIEYVRACGNIKDEAFARKTERGDIHSMIETTKAVNAALGEESESISQKMKQLTTQHLEDIKGIEQDSRERLSGQRESFESTLQQNEAIARREITGIRENTQRLEARREELEQALKESDKKLNELRKKAKQP